MFGIKTPKKDELILLGSPLKPSRSQADSLGKKTNELGKGNGIVEKLDDDDAKCFFHVEQLLQSAKVVELVHVSMGQGRFVTSHLGDKTFSPFRRQ